MPKKTSITIALLLTISILLPIFATAAEIGNIKTGDFIRTADYKERKENNQNEIKPIGDPEIKIIFPKRGWLQIFGIAIIPYGKTLVIGSVLNIVGYAANINKLECIIKNVKTGDIVYRESIGNFRTGQFTFTWDEAKRGYYQITVWEAAGFAPSAQDILNVKVL